MSRMQPKTKEEEWARRLRNGDEFSIRAVEREVDAELARWPTNPLALSIKAFCCVARHNLEKAVDYYEAAIRFSLSQQASVHYNLASVFQSLGRNEDSLREAKEAERLNHDGSVDPQSIQFNIAGALINLYRFDEARQILVGQRELGVPLIAFEMFFFLFGGCLEEAIHLAGAFDDSGSPIGSDTLPAPDTSDSLYSVFKPLIAFLRSVEKAIYTPGQVLESLDLPPENIKPGTPDYIEWWRQELSDPHWEEDVRATLDLLANPEMMEKIEEGLNEPSESLTSWKDLKASLGL